MKHGPGEDTLLDRAVEWLSRPWRLLRRGAYRARHIAAWLPVLWSDYDWDHAYMLRVLRFKVRRMRECQERERLAGDWKTMAREIRFAELLLGRLIDDDYRAWEYEEHRRKYGEPGHDSYVNADGHTVWPSTHGTPEGDNILRIGREAEGLRKQDRKALWRLMYRKSETWWS